MKKLTDINYSRSGVPECLLDAYLPDLDSYPVFVYIHGGGLVGGDKGLDGLRLATYLIPRGVGVVSLNYRMYPNAKYPDFIEDCAEGVRWVLDNLRPAADRIILGGSSAGGYISMMLCFDGRYLAAAGVSPSDIKGYIHDAGQPTVHFNVLAERGVDSRRVIIDEAAPLYHIGEAEKYPPMLFLWSDDDMPSRPEQLALTVSTMRHLGYDMTKVETMIRHGKHDHYIIAPEGATEFEFSSLVYPFIEKYGR